MEESSPPRLTTKKELERRYQLADTTVYKTLQACGLSTAKRRYTETEVSERFDIARHLLDHGYTYAQVRQYFSMKVATHTEDHD